MHTSSALRARLVHAFETFATGARLVTPQTQPCRAMSGRLNLTLMGSHSHRRGRRGSGRGVTAKTTGSPFALRVGHYRSLSLSCIASLLNVAMGAAAPGFGHTEFTRMSPDDPGLARAYLGNPGAEALVIDIVVVDGREFPWQELSDPAQPPWDFVRQSGMRLHWIDVRPNPIPAGGVGEFRLRFRRPPIVPVVLEVRAACGARFLTRVRPVNSRLWVEAFGLHHAGEKCCVYVRSSERVPKGIGALWMDGRDVSASTEGLNEPVPADRPFPLVVAFPEPLAAGSIHLRVEATGRRLAAESRVFATRTFPIAAWDTSPVAGHYLDRRAPRHFPWPGRRYGAAPTRCEGAAETSYVIGGDVNHRDLRHTGEIGGGAQALVGRAHACRILDPRRPTFLNIVPVLRDVAAPVYGPLADLFSSCNYPVNKIGAPLDRTCEVFERSRQACRPVPLIAIIEAFCLRERYPTGREMRLAAYGALAAGARGILYYRGSGPHGFMLCPAIHKDLHALNGEIRLLKRHLAWACPSRFPVRAGGEVTGSLLLVGREAVVLLLWRPDPKRTSAGPVKVHVTLPPWLNPAQVYEIGGNWAEVRSSVGADRGLEFVLPNMALTAQIVVSRNRGDREVDSDGDGIPDCAEVRTFGTDPDEPFWEVGQ